MTAHAFLPDDDGLSCVALIGVLECNRPATHPLHQLGAGRPVYVPPVVRTADPATSHDAAARYEPQRGTAKARVLAYLRARPGVWVDAVELTAPEVGGFAGTRRLRELRDLGHPIETRPKPGTANTWQHRLPADLTLTEG